MKKVVFLIIIVLFIYPIRGIGQGTFDTYSYFEESLYAKTINPINPFDLKNKTVIIPPYKYSKQIDNVYCEKALKHNRFDEKNKVDVKLYGKEIYVSDVIFIDKNDNERAVCLLVYFEGKRYVLHFPLFKVEYDKKDFYYRNIVRIGQKISADNYKGYDGFFGHVEVGRAKLKYHLLDPNSSYYQYFSFVLYDPCSLKLLVYNVDEIRNIVSSIEKRNVFFDFSEEDIKPFDYEKISQRPWKYEDIIMPWQSENFDYCSGHLGGSLGILQEPMYYQFVNKNDMFLCNARYIGDLTFEDDYLKRCESLYYDADIETYIKKYSKQLLCFKNELDGYYWSIRDAKKGVEEAYRTTLKGIYFCDTIDLCYTNSKDSVYYSYHAVLKKVNQNNTIEERNYYYPIKDITTDEIELNSVVEERKRIETIKREKEEDERRLQEQKEELEYHQMLVRKYGKANAKLIEEGEVKVGFTKAMCIEAWGEPDGISKTTTVNGTLEQWYYEWDDFLFFIGNKLVGIHEFY